MTHITTTKYITAPPQTVFDVATDLENATQHVAGIERIELLTPKPIGVGTRWRETRKMFGREETEELTITKFDPPHGYTAECESCGCHMASTFRLTPEGNGTRLDLEVVGRPISLMAKIMTPLTGWMMTGTMRRMLEADLESVRQAAERRYVTSA